jgi:hypothetical protein
VFIFKASLDDVDKDGLPDPVENSSVGPSGPWRLPTGEALPDIHAMGANSGCPLRCPDLFVEVAAMRTVV